MRRAVVTGIGIVSPLGCGKDAFWRRLTAGESGIRRIQNFDTSDYDVHIAGEVVEFDADTYISKKDQRRIDRYSQYALAAAGLALEDSGLDLASEEPERIGVIVSSGIGGLLTLQQQHQILLERGPDRCSPFMIPQMISNMASGLIAIEHNLQGPNYAIVSACATSAHCVGDALRIIERGDADVIVAGGSEAAVCELGIAGFSNMRALSRRNDEPTKASRPFDGERDGFVMGEGSGVIVLEELERAKARGATIYCEVAGYATTCDANHITAPDQSGKPQARAFTRALEDAGVNAEDVDYINAHGTSTQLNDKIETQVVKLALGEENARKVMISSTKSMTGHLLGAAGSVESAVCALAITNGVLPPTINQEHPDPECDLDYIPNTAREVPVKVCASNSLGFGGHNVTLVLRAL